MSEQQAWNDDWENWMHHCGCDICIDNYYNSRVQRLRVVHMPGRMAGQATIGDTRIDCRQIASMVWAGDAVADIADAYQLTPDDVRLACWWLAEHGLLLHEWEWEARDAWQVWASRWGGLSSFDQDPPVNLD